MSVLDAACVIVDVPAVTPVMVTSCAMLQLVDVNVSVAGDTVATPVVPLLGVTVTSAVGWVFSLTVYTSVDPSITPTALLLTVMPGDTVTVAATEAMERLVGYLGSVLVVTACVMVEEPTSTPVTVKVCAVFQLVGVNVRVAGDTVAAVVVPLVAPTTTLAVGLESSTTV